MKLGRFSSSPSFLNRTGFFLAAAIFSLFCCLGFAQLSNADEVGTPREIDGLRVTQVALGDDHSAAITEDGSLWTWGNNRYGQLGDGTTEDRLYPVKVMSDVSTVTLGIQCSAAITNDGTLWMWGNNFHCKLGEGMYADHYCNPIKVLEEVRSVSIGADHSAAIKEDNSLWMWGDNHDGQLGDGTTNDRRFPEKTMDDVIAISLGGRSSAAIRSDGTLWMWGDNAAGTLGDGTSADRYEPILVMNNVDSISLGRHPLDCATAAAITKDGSLWMWGDNYYGQVGDSTTVDRYKPTKVMDSVACVSVGDGHSAAIKNDGSLWTWGNNDSGELGNGKAGVREDVHYPIHVLDNAKSLSLGGSYSAAVLNDGTLLTWGYNGDGRLGDGTTENRSRPVRVLGFGSSSADPTPGAITVESNPQDTEEPEFTLGSTIEFEVPSDVPFIGGGEISLDMGLVPVEFWRQGNQYRIGIGVDDLEDLINGGGWATFKKFVGSQKKSIAKGLRGLDLARTYGSTVISGVLEPEMSIWGYAEGTITEDGIQSVEGTISLGMHAKGKQEWQTIVVVVPVVITFNADVGVDVAGSVGVDFDSAEIYVESDIDLTLPKIKLTGGVGVAYVADISVYGSATNTVSLEGGLRGNLSAALSGELGARARFLCFEYEKAFLEGEWEYYDSANKGRSATVGGSSSDGQDGWFGIERDIAGPWQGASSSRTRTLSTNSVVGETGILELQQNVYDGAEPQLIETSSGVRALIYTLDQEGLPDGHSTTPYASVYDEQGGVWAEPVPLLGEDAIGYDADYCVVGDRVWVVQVEPGAPLTDAQQQLSAEEQLEVIAGSSRIVLRSTEIDSSGRIVPSDNVEYLSEQGSCGLMPSVSVSDDPAGVNHLGVSWVENSNVDPMVMSGNNTVCAWTCVVDGDSLSDESEASTTIGDAPVAAVTLGQLDGRLLVAYVTDTDGNLASLDDRVMHLLDVGDGAQSTVSATGVLGPQFVSIGTADCLAWYDASSGSILYVASAHEAEPVVLAEGDALSPNFSVAQGAGEQLLLTSEDKDSEETGSNLVARRIQIDGSGAAAASNPVVLTDAAGYVSDITGIPGEDGWEFAFLRSDVTVEMNDPQAPSEQDRVLQEANLCVLSADEATSLEIADVTFDLYGGDEGNVPTVLVDVRNNGLAGTGSGSVTVSVDGGVLATLGVDALAAGEERVLEIPLSTVAGTFDLGETAQVTVALDEADEVSQDVVIGLADLVLSAEGGADGVTLVVANEGVAATDAELQVRKGTAGGSVLETIGLGAIAPGSSVEKSLGGDAVAGWGVDEVCLVAVPSGTDDAYEDDNCAPLYVGESGILGASLDRIRVSLWSDTFETGAALDLSGMEVTAILSDGTEVAAQSYVTNADEIDTSLAGPAELVVTCRYAERVASVVIPIELVDPDPGVDPAPDPDPSPDPSPDPEPEPTPEPDPEPEPTPKPDPEPQPQPQPQPQPAEAVTMHRLYNRWTGEHFYTASDVEKAHLVSVGWTDEGTGWTAPTEGAEVYRLYNPYVEGGDHHYTMSAEERDSLVDAGWNYEGVGWRSAPKDGGVPLYRQYNPYAKTGTHNYTVSKGENDHLVSVGWRYEGVAWYGVAQ